MRQVHHAQALRTCNSPETHKTHAHTCTTTSSHKNHTQANLYTGPCGRLHKNPTFSLVRFWVPAGADAQAAAQAREEAKLRRESQRNSKGPVPPEVAGPQQQPGGLIGAVGEASTFWMFVVREGGCVCICAGVMRERMSDKTCVTCARSGACMRLCSLWCVRANGESLVMGVCLQLQGALLCMGAPAAHGAVSAFQHMLQSEHFSPCLPLCSSHPLPHPFVFAHPMLCHPCVFARPCVLAHPCAFAQPTHFRMSANMRLIHQDQLLVCCVPGWKLAMVIRAAE